MNKSILAFLALCIFTAIGIAGENNDPIPESKGDGWILSDCESDQQTKPSQHENDKDDECKSHYSECRNSRVFKPSDAYLNSAAVDILEGLSRVYQKSKSESFFVLPFNFDLK